MKNLPSQVEYPLTVMSRSGDVVLFGLYRDVADGPVKFAAPPKVPRAEALLQQRELHKGPCPCCTSATLSSPIPSRRGLYLEKCARGQAT